MGGQRLPAVLAALFACGGPLAIAVLVLEPWDAAVIPPANDPAYRWTVFGAGYGLLSSGVKEAAELIRNFRHSLDGLR